MIRNRIWGQRKIAHQSMAHIECAHDILTDLRIDPRLINTLFNITIHPPRNYFGIEFDAYFTSNSQIREHQSTYARLYMSNWKNQRSNCRLISSSRMFVSILFFFASSSEFHNHFFLLFNENGRNVPSEKPNFLLRYLDFHDSITLEKRITNIWFIQFEVRSLWMLCIMTLSFANQIHGKLCKQIKTAHNPIHTEHSRFYSDPSQHKKKAFDWVFAFYYNFFFLQSTGLLPHSPLLGQWK